MFSFPYFIRVHPRQCRAILLPLKAVLPLFDSPDMAALAPCESGVIPVTVAIENTSQLSQWLRTTGCDEVCWDAYFDDCGRMQFRRQTSWGSFLQEAAQSDHVSTPSTV